MGRQSTIPVQVITRDLTRELSNNFPDRSYNDLLLEMMAQFDPSQLEFSGDESREHKAARVAIQHDLAVENIQGLPEDDSELLSLVSGSAAGNDAESTGTDSSSDTDDPVTT